MPLDLDTAHRPSWRRSARSHRESDWTRCSLPRAGAITRRRRAPEPVASRARPLRDEMLNGTTCHSSYDGHPVRRRLQERRCSVGSTRARAWQEPNPRGKLVSRAEPRRGDSRSVQAAASARAIAQRKRSRRTRRPISSIERIRDIRGIARRVPTLGLSSAITNYQRCTSSAIGVEERTEVTIDRLHQTRAGQDKSPSKLREGARVIARRVS